MKKRLLLSVLVMLSVSQIWAQLQRSDEFHGKYTLTGVTVFSRHNIRAPMAEAGGILSKMTPHQWHDFGVLTQNLTMKGGMLETTNGQFFHKWVVKEGLFAENAEPTDEELYILSNSKQRTISTARHFAASFMPMKTVTVHHAGKVDDMDPDFTLNLGTDLTDAQMAQIKNEYDAAWSTSAIRTTCTSLKDNFDLLTKVLDVENSEGYKDGSFKGFTTYEDAIDFSKGKEPQMTGILNSAGTPIDALILQYYELKGSNAASFNNNLTLDQWKMLTKLLALRDEIRFSSPFVQRYVSIHQRQMIADALQKEGRKFTFLCGHDTNIHNILKALRTKEYETTEAIEYGTPIASKIVFEKWTDASGKNYIAVNHVYSTLDELCNNTLLDLTTRPNIIPLHFDDLSENEDGLIPMEDMINRLTDRDIPTAVKAVSSDRVNASAKAYTIDGVSATAHSKGIVIENGRKSSRRK